MSEINKDLQDYRMRNPLVEQLSDRIKELEKESIENLEVWKAQQVNANTLSSHIEVLEIKNEQAEFRIKELENNIDDPEWCCTKHKAWLIERAEQAESRLKKLQDAVDRHKVQTEEYLSNWHPFESPRLVRTWDEELYKIRDEKEIER